MSKNDGGPAYPAPEAAKARFGESNPGAFLGMSLRDYFAAKFMAGRAAVPGSVDHEWDAKEAYKAADAMLIERAK